MPHDSRIDFCIVCKNRSYSSKLGVICVLIDNRPDFEDDCENFIEDPVAVVRSMNEEEEGRVVQQYQPSGRFEKSIRGVGKDERIVLGVFNIFVALIWFGIGLFYFERIHYFPMLLFAFGVYKLVNGIIKRRKESEIQALLDEEMKKESD